ncbi:DUF2156 domain-containing protein [Acetonema longum]|uniref:Phosphatidylglycerol lysyltransferase C-terminal domain-containing protein n=1 Tax=Acetonema longum DSM 6540 TaxID=1009370 RepID=F7NMC1_9FIRM|nr:phosphatidylglycerol lysyltransferase domain-containing protein [Acetonema longum]EGO62797.1 hypothetical protein ALO_16297 [Acetonema longum DSM 6540]
MILFRDIQLTDKPVFDRYFLTRRYEQSACTFTHLFMWRKWYNICWAEADGYLCLKASYDGVDYILPPFGEPEGYRAVMEQMLAHFAATGHKFLMKAATPDIVELLEKFFPGKFQITPDRDNFDYVYAADDLIHLKGKNYHTKKNHLNSFKRLYSDYEYKPLTKKLVPDCIEYAGEWCIQNGCDKDPSLVLERNAIQEALLNFDQLSFQGGVLYVNGKVVAFTMGEKLNNDTAVIHVEKANFEMRGGYQAINQMFCAHAWSDMQFINREEDMGLEGIRKAKESYFPVKYIEKYDVVVK